MRKQYFLSVCSIVFILVLSVSSCPIERCDPASLVAPISLSPSNFAIVGIRPSLIWTYPESCAPDYYEVQLSPVFDLTDTGLFGTTPDRVQNWEPSVDLELGRQYWWKVAPISGGERGPWSERMSFITGPLCLPDKLQAPTLLYPADGAIISDPQPMFAYNPTGPCTPEGYFINLQTNPTFSDPLGPGLEGELPVPSTRTFPSVPLGDCTMYYWRVKATLGTDEGPFSERRMFMTDFTGSCLPPESTLPACDPASLVAPDVPVSPSQFEIVGIRPSLTWTYPDSCAPDYYEVHLSPMVDLTDTGLFGITTDSTPLWAPAVDLEFGRQYWWKVAAVVGGTPGPLSSINRFVTGPICSDADLVAPTLLYPADGAIINDPQPMFAYNPTGPCTPEEYYFDLQTDPTFSTPIGHSGETVVPGTRLFPSDPLDDCIWYYWRVAGQNGPFRGPFSATWDFFTNFSGACPFVPRFGMLCQEILGVWILPDGQMRINIGMPDASGEYKAKINTYEITCQTYEEYPDSLLCDSPKPPTNSLAELTVWDPEGNEICLLSFSVPAPEEATEEPDDCTPPPGGCGDPQDPNGGHYWDEKACQCAQCPYNEVYINGQCVP